jgi:hypothetical protein
LTTIASNESNGNGSKRRVMSWLPGETVIQMDKMRSYYSRSQFMQVAVDKLLENITKQEGKGGIAEKG